MTYLSANLRVNPRRFKWPESIGMGGRFGPESVAGIIRNMHVEPGVTKKTSILVVGDQDVTKLAGKDKSSKHRKAEGLIANGQAIRILRESDFKELVNQAEDI